MLPSFFYITVKMPYLSEMRPLTATLSITRMMDEWIQNIGKVIFDWRIPKYSGKYLSEDQFFILKSHTDCCGREDGLHEPCPGL